MKFNLKNFPLLEDYSPQYEKLCDARAAWKKGFEAELRENRFPKEDIKANEDDDVIRVMMKAKNALIKEILGE